MFIARGAFPRISVLSPSMHARAARYARSDVGIRIVTSPNHINITIKKLTGETLIQIKGDIRLRLFETIVNRGDDNIIDVVCMVVVRAIQTGRLHPGVKKLLVDYVENRI